MNNSEIKIFTLNPIHSEFDNIPKFRKLVPRLNIFNEIVYDLSWFSYLNILDKYKK